MTIKAVLFDFGGTLFDFSPSNYSILASVTRKYGKLIEITDPILGVAFQKQEEYIFDTLQKRNTFRMGSFTQEDWVICDQILLESLYITDPNAIKDLIEAFTNRMFHFQFYPETLPALHHLKNQGIQLGIVSNLEHPQQIVRRYQQLKEYHLFELMDTIILSGEHGVRKPDPEIFNIALRDLPGIMPQETIYVGDSYIFDIVGARNAHLHPVLLDANPGKTYDCLSIPTIPALLSVIEHLNTK
jgi:putative hydrolase of the HAD superfamily